MIILTLTAEYPKRPNEVTTTTHLPVSKFTTWCHTNLNQFTTNNTLEHSVEQSLWIQWQQFNFLLLNLMMLIINYWRPENSFLVVANTAIVVTTQSVFMFRIDNIFQIYITALVSLFTTSSNYCTIYNDKSKNRWKPIKLRHHQVFNKELENAQSNVISIQMSFQMQYLYRKLAVFVTKFYKQQSTDFLFKWYVLDLLNPRLRFSFQRA